MEGITYAPENKQAREVSWDQEAGNCNWVWGSGGGEDVGNWTDDSRMAESRGQGERAGRLRGLGGVGAHFLAGSGLRPRGEALLEGTPVLSHVPAGSDPQALCWHQTERVRVAAAPARGLVTDFPAGKVVSNTANVPEHSSES